LSRPGSVAWLAHHELRLAWRDVVGLIAGSRRRRTRVVIAAILAFVAFMHLLAYSIVEQYAGDVIANRTTLLVLTGSAFLAASLMLSQAIEMVTRAFYARADLDLILSSPISADALFAVRVSAIALSSTFMAIPMAGPFINALAYADGPGWLAAYAVIAAMGCAATALAVMLTVVLFRTLGPKRTRLMAQIVAAVVGAAFVIGIQVAAILATGSLSRFALLHSNALLAHLPSFENVLWWPARAAMGDMTALLPVITVGLALLLVAITGFSRRFGEYAMAASGVSASRIRQRKSTATFRNATPAQTLRRKEWLLLQRDPWLVSQTLIQILYLLPPALLLWRNFGAGKGALIVLVPVIVMAAGQLAGGLAWLAVSGEDAPDLVASAPVSQKEILAAKVEAVTGGIALVVLPLILVLTIASPFDGIVCVAGVMVAASSATLIQLWFRTQARRSQFRRRQTSSRLATFAEAFSSIAWAGTAFLVAAQTWLALIPGTAALFVLAGARAIRPR
jgi:ABC-2 type transport system permease protein